MPAESVYILINIKKLKDFLMIYLMKVAFLPTVSVTMKHISRSTLVNTKTIRY